MTQHRLMMPIRAGVDNTNPNMAAPNVPPAVYTPESGTQIYPGGHYYSAQQAMLAASAYQDSVLNVSNSSITSPDPSQSGYWIPSASVPSTPATTPHHHSRSQSVNQSQGMQGELISITGLFTLILAFLSNFVLPGFWGDLFRGFSFLLKRKDNVRANGYHWWFTILWLGLNLYNPGEHRAIHSQRPGSRRVFRNLRCRRSNCVQASKPLSRATSPTAASGSQQLVFDQKDMQLFEGKRIRPRTEDDRLHRQYIKEKGPCEKHRRAKRKVSWASHTYFLFFLFPAFVLRRPLDVITD